tara:strand:+ start:2260 stop:2505 length:246 start_codon:yes stop_codon:yes gene_type:complete
MKYFEIILVVGFLAIPMFWLFFSPQARSTRELEKLNRIWERFNAGTITPEEAESAANEIEWRYHPEKVKLFRMHLSIYKKK